ncbi:MAG TPA: protein kinase [Vicinamibacterales bacterium]|nr:protein kinase [Vicinamibacterales bacterium]
MPFAVGARLGRFEILGSLGAGGMGEVYRARDLQLQRDVAIKVLPAAFSGDADRRRRFEQEARAAGSLNHPNILAVHDVGTEGASSYIVTELLEGETLRERMGGRPLPARKAADYALQIASGLAAGHERGVVHRDIKPENLFVTTDGRIKILDFGLAKLIGDDGSGNTETITIDGESRTPVMGTVAYMSPEQARGQRIDHRTDIFSLGVVLYEMLVGFPPFRRGTTGDTINAILHDEPPEFPQAAAAPALERTVRHCLEKKPEERFQNVRDLIFHLETRPHESGPVTVAGRHTRSRRTLLVGATLLALSAAAAIGAYVTTRLMPPPPSSAVHRARLMTDLVGLEEFPSISPDGNMVAFTAAQAGRRQVFIRFLTRGPSRPVTSDEADHQLPRWLPDGSSLVYFSPAAPGEVQGAIYKIPTLGGLSQRLIASIGGGDVSRSGRLTCFRLENQRIQLVTSALDGSDVQPVATLETRHYRYPRWSPDNQWIAFQAGDGFRWDLYVVSVRGDAKPVRLTNENRFIAGLTWLPNSTGIVFAWSRGTTVPYLPPLALWEVLLDGRQPPRQLTPAEASYEQPDLHESGLLSVARLQMRFDLWKYPFGSVAADNFRRGQRVTLQTGQVLTPTAAPDGDQIAYLSDSGGHSNIWVTSTQGPPRQITFEDDPTVVIGLPIWSPDGRWIAFVSSRGNAGFVFGIWLVRPDASELHQLVQRGLGVAWSSKGDEIYYVENAQGPMKKVSVNSGEPVTVRSEPVRNMIGVHESTVYFLVERALMDGRPEFEIRAAPLGNGPTRVIKTIDASRVASWQVPFNPALSPDGKWLAMPLTDGLTTNIWALSTEDGRWQQVTDFGDRAIFIARRVSWSSDGRSILAAVGEGDADIVLLDGLIKK